MIEILGIRHHGIGSASYVLQRLRELEPDCILVEGPPEIDPLLPYIGTTDLRPPVSIMLYDESDPKRSNFYPFAEYSPEWVAVKYANENNIKVSALDLPSKISFATPAPDLLTPTPDEEIVSDPDQLISKRDPLSYLSEIAGFKDSGAWWNYQFERTSNQSAKEHFEAVQIAMTALRAEGLESSLDKENIGREAYMRKIIKAVLKEGYENIVIVCGAWHAPSLTDIKSHNKEDKEILKSLPKSNLKIKASWIPWTNSRLSMFSGYGAGITSPGWYEHLWNSTADIEVNWLTKIAVQFREEGMDISTAHILEAYRLCKALGQIREQSVVTLDDLNESVLTVMCMGDAILLELIKTKLIVGDKIGTVPDDIPKVPLQLNFEKTIKTLRLKLSAAPKQYDLDLRKEIDLKRSVLFHRLEILEIPWANRTSSRSKGTFKESWTLTWAPEMMIALIDKAYLGNTIESAALSTISELCANSDKVAKLSAMIIKVIPAELNDVIDTLLNRIDTLSSISSDIQDLMEAIPSLVSISRYGDVRKSNLTIIEDIVDRLYIKVFIGLPNASYGLDEENSNNVFNLISELNNSIKIFDHDDITKQWYTTLLNIVDRDGVHDIIQGCTCRLLLDAEQITADTATNKIMLALSVARDPTDVASWIEGFLRGSGMILLYDDRLWNLLYEWLDQLEEDIFMGLLPYLRRAFSKFEFAERRQIGQKAKHGLSSDTNGPVDQNTGPFNEARTIKVMDTISMLIGKPQNN